MQFEQLCGRWVTGPSPSSMRGLCRPGTSFRHAICRHTQVHAVAGCCRMQPPRPPPDTARSCRVLFFANTCSPLVESGTSDGHVTFAGYFHDELYGKREKNSDHKQWKKRAHRALIHQPSIQEADIQPTEVLFRSTMCNRSSQACT